MPPHRTLCLGGAAGDHVLSLTRHGRRTDNVKTQLSERMYALHYIVSRWGNISMYVVTPLSEPVVYEALRTSFELDN